MAGYNVGTGGYRTEEGSSEGRNYRVGKGYEMAQLSADGREELYEKRRKTGMEYERGESRMETLMRIAFAPKIDIGRGLN